MSASFFLNKAFENNKNNNLYTPQFYRFSIEGQKDALAHLINSHAGIVVHDTMYSQLVDLMKYKKPNKKLTQNEIDADMVQHLNGCSLEDYGVWVYYPWSNRVVHLLDEEEFVMLRTSRNNYKITRDEQRVLSTKVVGVVGLSVGQSVSLTMAMERMFGELRIADFDELELTNLNRIRSGVHNMGLKKTVMVAREIAEIDPYLKVTLFSEGLTKDNLDAFFIGDKKLDLVIDECDSLDVKILLRIKAKSLQMPVLMEASDRGTVDVERFDLEPERPLLHGFISHLDHTKIGSLTNEQKIPYILPMLGLIPHMGIDTLSKRLKASMVEVEQSINTWPQLASAVVLGGALCADVCRRILLDKYRESGRYNIDIEELIGDRVPQMEGEYNAVDWTYPELTIEQMKRMADMAVATFPITNKDISSVDIESIVAAAVEAPSAGNNQPWKWLSYNGALFLYHDKNKSYSWTDEEGFIAQLSLGTAVENAVVKAASLGYEVSVSSFPLGESELLVAILQFIKADGKLDVGKWAPYIGSRCTNRKHGQRQPLSGDVLAEMQSLASAIPGAHVSFLTEQQHINDLALVESAAERVRFMHPQSHYEFFNKELRWNESGKEIIREGLDIKTLELSIGNETGMRVASDPAVIALLNSWGQGKVFEKAAREAIVTSSAIGLLTMPEYSAINYVNGGRAAERLWLDATARELSIHPISAPLFLYAKLKYGNTEGFSQKMMDEIKGLFDKLCILFPSLENQHGIFMFRLSVADAPTSRSLKQPLNKVLSII